MLLLTGAVHGTKKQVKQAKQVKSAGVKAKTYVVSKDRWVLVSSVCILIGSILLVSLSGFVTKATHAEGRPAAELGAPGEAPAAAAASSDSILTSTRSSVERTAREPL